MSFDEIVAELPNLTGPELQQIAEKAEFCVWTPIAIQDLRAICDFISRGNPVVAHRMGEELIKQSEAIAAFPTERSYGA